MYLKLCLFLTVFVSVFAETLSIFRNPFSSLRGVGVVKNEARKLISSVEGDVRRMQMNNPFSSTLLRGQPAVDMSDISRRLQHPFNYSTCDSSKQVIEIKSLTLKPTTLSFPGDLTFSFDIVFHDNIETKDNVTAYVTLEFLTGRTWLKLPCLGTIGSCPYVDICSQLASVPCPPEFKDQGVRCNCPFSKGEYKLSKPFTVAVDSEVFINGNYRAKINMTSTSKGQLACYNLGFTII